MVSPEVLRRYPFFAFLGDSEMKAVAMIAEEVHYEVGQDVYTEGQPAHALYFLLEGCVEHHFVLRDEDNPEIGQDFYVGEVDAGEILGLSALIDPFVYTTLGRVSETARLVRLDAAALRALCEVDPRMGYGLMRAAAKAAMGRLHDTRMHLAGART